MPPVPHLPASLRRALDDALAGRPRLVLAVSGGLDSMALLHAVAQWREGRDVEVVVATYDHGTGPAAARARRPVMGEARRLGLAVRAARARTDAGSEAGWRRRRWRWLRRVARASDAAIVTAHTRDDQVETVLMRILRGSGARGLAGLRAPSAVLRPWLDVSRAELAAWVAAEGIAIADDPSNRDRRHLRNRVRLDLLPALRRVRPGMDAELLAIGERAADWRRAVERVVDGLGLRRARGPGVYVATGVLARYPPEARAVLWPAIAARAGVRLDRRGTERLAAVSTERGRPGRVPLSGGAEVLLLGDRMLVRPRAPAGWPEERLDGRAGRNGWRLRPAPSAPSDDRWTAALPADARLTVREWRPGDRLAGGEGRAARRVKRCFGDAGVPGPLRAGWPVVLADDEIVWIPGVGRSVAATARPGRPAVHYRCDRSPC